MKKYINNKSYDTETAKEVGSNGSECGYRDFHWWTETLYCKRTGEYFLYGEGGPMSKYRHQIEQSGWSSGEQIIPLTVDQAREWAQENLSTSEYDAEFGEIAEDDSTTVLSISIRADVAENVRRAAAEAGMSLSKFIESRLQND